MLQETKYWIDVPEHGRFTNAFPICSGWIAWDQPDCTFQISLDGPRGPIPYDRISRPDVEQLFPGLSVLGFQATLETEIETAGELPITANANGRILARMVLDVTPDSLASQEHLRASKQRKRAWCLSHWRCSACAAPDFKMNPGEIVCQSCGTSFPQDTRALNCLSATAYRLSRLTKTANISSHEYDDRAEQMIAEISMRGGKILDCGAGFRTTLSDTVINLEIVDYLSTDVLAAGQSLPFADGVFDAVFSFAVLEHVNDPFACARELTRVLKPGGLAYVSVPFLQPEHGYPDHYFNMTRQGLRTLFPAMRIREQFVPVYGRPVVSLHWIASSYARSLEGAARERFLDLSFGELLAKGQYDWLDDDLVTKVSEAGNFELASATNIMMEKSG